MSNTPSTPSTPSTGPTAAAARDLTAAERQAARARRERLHRALVELEEALTAPGTEPDWLERVRDAAAIMHETVVDHVAESEAPDGLLSQITEVSPWLGPRVEHLRGEHDHLVEAADALVRRCEAATVEEADVVDDAGWALLEEVSRHRRRGADLLYDAYALDVSAAD
jgi:hypothetical protein